MRETRLYLAAIAFLSLFLPGAAFATTDSDDPLDQTVSEHEEIGTEKVVVDQGHMDIGPKFLDGEWVVLVRDDSVSPPVWRHPEDLVVSIGGDSMLTMPEDEEFAFIPADPGQELYVIPQTQLTDVAWLGWNTQDPEVVEQIVGGATLRFHGYEGPGGFTLFLQNGNFAPPTLLWDGENPEPQDIWANANTHVHANWVFTEPGTYRIDVEVLATLKDGSEVSDRSIITIAVGDEVDPELLETTSQAGTEGDNKESLASGEEEPRTEGESETEASPGSANETTEDGVEPAPGSGGTDDGRALSTGLIATAIITVFVLVGAGYGVLRSRRARKIAMETNPGCQNGADSEEK